jgi:hypothetical protein
VEFRLVDFATKTVGVGPDPDRPEKSAKSFAWVKLTVNPTVNPTVRRGWHLW